MSKLKVTLKIMIIARNKNISLVLLNEYALNAAFNVPTLEDQKFIKKNEVNPIISQPKNNIIKFPEDTKKIILIIKPLKNNINRSISGSYRKYEKVYGYTHNAIVNVKKEKLNEILSIKKSKVIL